MTKHNEFLNQADAFMKRAAKPANLKCTRVIYGGACHDFDPADFLALAMEALDQAGLSHTELATVEHTVKMMGRGADIVPIVVCD